MILYLAGTNLIFKTVGSKYIWNMTGYWKHKLNNLVPMTHVILSLVGAKTSREISKVVLKTGTKNCNLYTDCIEHHNPAATYSEITALLD